MLLFVFVLLSSFPVKPAHPFKPQATMASLLLIGQKILLREITRDSPKDLPADVFSCSGNR
jgi:hypothetical protein